MANKLSDELASLTQRTGTNASKLRTEAERAAFSSNVRADIASVVYQYNTVIVPLLSTLSSEEGLNSLDKGLSGNVMFTHIDAVEGDAAAYYDTGLGRKLTVKETVDVLLGELGRLENIIEQSNSASEVDTSAIEALVNTNTLNIEQVAKDAFGLLYTLDDDGNPDLAYSLSQALDAIGAFFTGFPGTGNTYSRTYPTLALSILLSDITIDTTLPQSTITDLEDHLDYIRAFMGMDTVGPETPTYSDHGALVFISDGDTLEESIQDLDAALATHASRHISGGADEVDGDQVDIDYSPTNYTPDTAPAEVTLAAHLTSHLAGIDNVLGTGLSWAPEILRAGEFKVLSADPGPTIVVEDYTNLALETLDYDAGATVEKAYSYASVPTDNAGNRPTKVKVIGHFVTKPNGGPYTGGTGFAFSVALSSGASSTPIPDNSSIVAGFQPAVTQTATGLSGSSLDYHYVLEWPTVTLGSNPLGLLGVRLARETADAADNWQNDVGLIALHVMWYA